MKQISMIDSNEAQAEYVKARQVGYEFTRQGNFAHYLFGRYMVEPSVLEELDAALGPAPFFIWTYRGCTMASARRGTATPCFDPLNWTRQTRGIAAELAP